MIAFKSYVLYSKNVRDRDGLSSEPGISSGRISSDRNLTVYITIETEIVAYRYTNAPASSQRS